MGVKRSGKNRKIAMGLLREGYWGKKIKVSSSETSSMFQQRYFHYSDLSVTGSDVPYVDLTHSYYLRLS